MDLTVAPAAVPVVVTSIIFTVIALVLVVTRLYTRNEMLKNAGADDFIIVAAMAASIGFCIVVFYQIKYGLGKPFKTIPLQDMQKFFQCLWATIPIYNLSLVLTKISIILQYMRIFPARKMKKLCRIMVGVLIVYGCWTVLGSTFMCIPVAYFWNPTIEGRCLDKLAFWFSNAALNITTDVMIFAIPMPLLKQLQLPKKQKIGLMFVFGFGAFVCITSVIRLKSIYEISVATDTSLKGVNAAIWSGIEINVAISCASLPALKPLISKFLPGVLSNLSSRNRSTGIGISANEIGSHQMNSLRSQSKSTTVHIDEIKVQQSVYQKRVDRPSLEESEKNLVNCEADFYAEERVIQQHEVV